VANGALAARRRRVTIILTTHYIEEAEEMADRIGIINHGELILVQDTSELIRRLGRKQLRIELNERLATGLTTLAQYGL